MLPFAWDNSSDSDGRQEASLLTSALVQAGGVEVIERESLDKILAEQKLLATGAVGQKEFAKTVGQIIAVDALIQGKIFLVDKATELHIRMLEVASGRILYAGHRAIPGRGMNLKRMMDFMAPVPEFGVTAPVLPDISVGEAQKPPAPANDNCGRQEMSRDNLERSIVDLKARFWAGRMLEPGFSSAGLVRNPGSEIANDEVRRQFYERLNYWHGLGYAPELSAEEWKTMQQAEDRLKQMEAACAPSPLSLPGMGPSGSRVAPANLPGVRP